MGTLTLGSQAQDFIWASGIENTFVPQIRPGHRALDEYQLIGHYQHWREDLALARDAGVQALRWGVPWYRVEPIPGEFDWRWTDAVIPYIVQELGITPIIDLMHYGCPFWLRNEFANPGYPQAVAAYSRAFAERYKQYVTMYTPFNEPVVSALLSGQRAAWPPYLRGDRGYIRVLLQIVRGIISTIEAVKETQPEASMVHVEATGICRAADASIAWLAKQNDDRGFLTFDLLTGKVVPGHPLYEWLLSNRASEQELAYIAANQVPIDLMGLNFYPQWSTQEVYINAQGIISSRTVEKDGVGFGQLVREFYTRYGKPIMITETSAKDADAERSTWLAASLAAVKGLREQGVPVMGYTWFPLFTMIDWEYRWGTEPLNNYLLDLGLYRLNPAGNGSRWRELPLLEEFRNCTHNSAQSIGHLAVS